jgi:hypothetical protein
MYINNRPFGENYPNLVTLVHYYKWSCGMPSIVSEWVMYVCRYICM